MKSESESFLFVKNKNKQVTHASRGQNNHDVSIRFILSAVGWNQNPLINACIDFCPNLIVVFLILQVSVGIRLGGSHSGPALHSGFHHVNNKAKHHFYPSPLSNIGDTRLSGHAFFCNAQEAKSGTIATKSLGSGVDFLGPATVPRNIAK